MKRKKEQQVDPSLPSSSGRKELPAAIDILLYLTWGAETEVEEVGVVDSAEEAVDCERQD